MKAQEADGETVTDGRTTIEALQAQVAAFPWPAGVLAGAGAFLAGYLVVVVYALVGIATLPGGPTEVATLAGFVFYNAHGVLVVGEAGPGVVAPSIDFLAQAASRPIIYQAVPVAVLAVVGGAFTYRQDGEEPDRFAVVGTGLSLALGYLAVALVGTFLFTTTQTSGDATVVFRPGRVGTLLVVWAYPLVVGGVASIVVQAVEAAE